MNPLFQILAASFVLCVALVQGRANDIPDPMADLYFRGYALNAEALRLEKAGEPDLAETKLHEAAHIMTRIAQHYPSWMTEMRAYRQRKISEALARLHEQRQTAAIGC